MENIINLTKITTLALADSVNPCAIAVLTMILVAIMIQNPDKKRKVLFAGIAFAASVFVGYLFYGIIIVEFFNKFAEFLRQNSKFIYDGLAIFAMIIGALNVKDYFYYKKGGLATEMPIFLRPKVKKIIQKVTSPKGAFIIGFAITLFLLPCTIGPYIIASGILAELGILGAIPWLLYYNLIFILPMLIIVFIVYFGFAKVDEVSGWKERNIRRLHLIAGILLFAVGVALLAGWL
ncbi:MAG: sulfite exporter TauE/SafE family protein [Candidatus Pacearchaeota archaeon]|jgi:cytochrome c biogenesis protein CcdA